MTFGGGSREPLHKDDLFMQSNSMSVTGIWMVGKHGFTITLAHDHPFCDTMLAITGHVNQDTSYNKSYKSHTMIHCIFLIDD